MFSYRTLPCVGIAKFPVFPYNSGMKTTYNKLPETVRTTALAAKRKQPRVNPYLFDVRKDRELSELLTDAADHGETVNLPVGAYKIDFTEAVDRMYDATITWVLVNAKGKTRYCYNGLPAEDTPQWVKWVQKFLGIPQKKIAKKSSAKRKETRAMHGY